MNVIEVVDVPEGLSEDEARVLLNKPCEINRYMLVQVLPLPGGIRAFYRLVSSAYDKKPGERNQLRTHGDGNHEKAVAYIQAHPEMSLRQISLGLAAMGIKRGRTWVCDARMNIRGSVVS